jgi:hypothetical protein
MDTAAGLEFIISDADPLWWLETGVFYSVNGLQYHTTTYSHREELFDNLFSFPLVRSLLFMFSGIRCFLCLSLYTIMLICIDR